MNQTSLKDRVYKDSCAWNNVESCADILKHRDFDGSDYGILT